MTDLSPEVICNGRDKHPTREVAARDARVKHATYGGRWEPYRCPFCGHHHIGPASRVKSKGAARLLRKGSRRRVGA